MSADPTPVHLLRGDDPVVLRDAVRELVHRIVGDADPSLAVEEVGEAAYTAAGGDPDVGPLVAAAQTPPFLTDRRVVVGRDLQLFSRADQVAPLVAYLDDPLPTTTLVLEWGGGRVPKPLVDAVARCGGEQVDTTPGRKVGEWVEAQLREAGVNADQRARARVVDWLGDDPSRLVSLIETLRSSFDPGVRLSLDDVEPFLGDGGGVPPWELTDAIDAGDIPTALAKLDRIVAGGGRHPLQVMATLHAHYARMLRLDGADVATEKEAAERLGLRGSTFPARKAMAQARRLGHDRIVRAFTLLAAADLDLRGLKDWPEPLVLELLVARLARLTPR